MVARLQVNASVGRTIRKGGQVAAKSDAIPAGSRVLVGAPAKPMSVDVSGAIARLIASLPAVAEAHLPQLYIRGQIDPPAQVLVVVAAPGADEGALLRQIGAEMAGILPSGMHIDAFPLPQDSPLLPGVRRAGCQIAGPDPSPSSADHRPWWRFW